MNTSSARKLIEDENIRELRCKKCKKLLGRIDKSYKVGYIELKCPRCKELNIYKDQRDSRSPGLYQQSWVYFMGGENLMAILYMLDKETLIKIYELRKRLVEEYGDFKVKDLMKHDAYKKIGRRVKQTKWGK